MTDSKTPDWADVAARALDAMPPEGPQLRSHRIAFISQALLSAYERGRKEGIEEAAKVAATHGKWGTRWEHNHTALPQTVSREIATAIRQLLEVKG